MRTIIIGAGKVGYSIAQMLALEKQDVVVIEKDASRQKIVEESLDVQTVLGSGASISVLQEAGVKDADLVVAVTEVDELNMIACLIAKQLGVPRTVARVRNPEYIDTAKIASCSSIGIDLIINPERVTAQMIAKLIEVPEAINVEYYADGKVQLLELRLTEEAPVVYKKLRDIQMEPPFLIVAILRHEQMIIPRGGDQLLPGDLIFVMAETKQMWSVEKMLGKERAKIEDITILGGGRIGFYLAKLLETKNVRVKVIECDLDKCKEISKHLKDTLILHGDGADISLLEEENTGQSDIFVAVTGDDKVNLLVSLLAKHLGVKKTIAQIRRSDYVPLVEKVGVDVAVSPRMLTAGAILKFIRRGDIVSVSLLGGAKAEMLEFIAAPSCRAANKPLRLLKFPNDAIIGAIVRGNQVIVPTGSAEILPGDHVIVFALPKAISKVEEFFAER